MEKSNVQLVTFWSVQEHKKTGKPEILVTYRYPRLGRNITQILKSQNKVTLGKLYLLRFMYTDTVAWFDADQLLDYKAIWHPKQLFVGETVKPIFQYPLLNVGEEEISLSVDVHGAKYSLSTNWSNIQKTIRDLERYKTSATPVKHIDYRGQVQLLKVLQNFKENVFQRMENKHFGDQATSIGDVIFDGIEGSSTGVNGESWAGK